jgi:hypothetical protein
MNSPLTITTSYRLDPSKGGDKIYLIRHYINGVEEIKLIETTRQRDGMGKDDWLEEALNWAFEQGRLSYAEWCCNELINNTIEQLTKSGVL